MAPRAPRITAAPAVNVALLDGWNASAAQRPLKRSLAIAGHRTSISLEAPFWDALRRAAREKGVSIAGLAAAIDAVRGDASLSSAIRLFVFDRTQVGRSLGAE